MRVVHVVPALFGPGGIVGGAERYAFELARHMSRAVPTTLVTFGDRDREEKVDTLTVRVLGNPWLIRRQPTNPFHLGVFRILQSADVVHCHQQHVLTSSLVALWCRATRRRVFVSDLGGGGWDVSAFVSTDGWYHGHLHLSHYSRSIQGQTREPSAQIISGGVDIERFSPGPDARDGSVLFVGRLLPHKGIEDLICALPPGMSLTIVGPKPEGDMATTIDKLVVGKSVTFKHGLNDAELVDEYRRALCVVLPSVYRTSSGAETRVPELLGQTLLEGMACETPAICTNVASLPEIVDDGSTGFIVPPNDPAALGDRLSWLHEHPHEARIMGRTARQRVLEHFTWPQVVQRCLDAYATVKPSPTLRKQCAAAAVLVLLIGGFTRASLTIGSQYSRLLERPARGASASVDWYLHASGHGRADELVRAVDAAQVPLDGQLVFAAPRSRVSEVMFWQSYMTVSYLLYPRHIWPFLWCDDTDAECTAVHSTKTLRAALDASNERFVIVLNGADAAPDPLPVYEKRTLAPGLTLLDRGLR